MEDKIEVGEYVRTNDGMLGKLLRIERDDIDTSLKWYVLYVPNSPFAKGELYTNKPYIVKHSKNIIDLIEVGDYVNGMLVTTIINMDENGNYIPCRIILCNRDGDCTLPPLKIYEKDIKSIVTKEQFETLEYKLDAK